jgi:hypothetical protein
MTLAAPEIFNPRTGQRMRFLVTAADTNGELLRIETTNPPTGVAEPLHVHPRQESRAEVMAGTLRFVVDGQERRLGPGETIAIPAGVPTSSQTTATRTPPRNARRACEPHHLALPLSGSAGRDRRSLTENRRSRPVAWFRTGRTDWRSFAHPRRS